jgi:hypothetical protein
VCEAHNGTYFAGGDYCEVSAIRKPLCPSRRARAWRARSPHPADGAHPRLYFRQPVATLRKSVFPSWARRCQYGRHRRPRSDDSSPEVPHG